MRFGLVGAGGIGQIRARALNTMPDCQLVGVFDQDKERARNTAPAGGRVWDTLEQLLLDAEVEAVVVSTPPQFHENIVVAALEAGKHVLCEKPLGSSVESCRVMVETSRKTGKVLTTGFNHRYFSAVQAVKQALDSGAIGELDHVRAFAGHTGLSEFKAPWMYDKDIMGGGALMDVGIHMIDLTRYLLGDIAEVYGSATTNVWKLDRSEDNGFALMRNAQGKHAIFHATWTEWRGYRFHIEAYGDKGMARASYAPMVSTIITMDKPGGTPRRQRNFYPDNIVREKIKGWQSTVVTTFQQEFTDFVRLCQQGQAGRIADGFAGFRAVEIANAIYQSTETKEIVTLSKPF